MKDQLQQTFNQFETEISPLDLERQLQLEKEGILLGEENLKKQLREAKANGLESTTFYGSYLVGAALNPLIQAINGFLEESQSGKAGPKHSAVKFLRVIDAPTAALITLQTVIDRLTTTATYQNVACKIGTVIELESRIRGFEKRDRKAIKKIRENVNKSTHSGHRSVTWKIALNREQLAWEETDWWTPWTAKERFLLGAKLIDLMITVTDIVEIRSGDAVPGKKALYVLTPTAKGMAWIERQENRAFLFPNCFPTLIPPRPWTGLKDGGYYYIPRKLPLIKNNTSVVSPDYFEKFANQAGQMTQVYDAVNSLQNTSYKVNQDVLGVFQEVWDTLSHDRAIAGLPQKENIDLPPCPICGSHLGQTFLHSVGRPADRETHPCFEKPENKEILTVWKRKAKKAYEDNITLFSLRIRAVKTLRLAEKFKDETAIYFPVQLDFRGRVYSVVSFLSPQSDDLGRSLLTFAEGKSLQTLESQKWFQVHGANCFGVDKVSFDERLAWVAQNRENIIATATDPLSNLDFWADSDKPWAFLAWCFEYATWQQEGDAFISHIPVHMDGSCNGLQIFSLMLRDEVGAAATNVLPSDQPADIYQIVADKVTEKLKEKTINGQAIYKAEEDDTKDGAGADTKTLRYHEKTLAGLLLALGVNRKSTKRQVMVLPYGGTFQSCKEYTLEHLQERRVQEPGATLFQDPDVDNYFYLQNCANFLARLIWEAIGETVVAAQGAMAYMQTIAGIANQTETPICWMSPAGFPAVQAYRDQKAYRIHTEVAGSRIDLSLNENSSKLDKHRQRNGVAPNFVHSLDAAALMLTINESRKAGIMSFTSIHDSYGVLAADAEVVSKVLRRVFCEIFGGSKDVLASWTTEVSACFNGKQLQQLPEQPPKGELDVAELSGSKYFFA